MSTNPLPDDARLPGRLIAFRADRLGARLISLVNAMRLAADHNADFACGWTETSGVGHVFNDPTELFEAAFVRRRFLDTHTWRACRSGCVPITQKMCQAPGAVVDALTAGKDLVVGNAFGIICLADEDHKTITRRFRDHFNRIPFASHVQTVMDSLAETLTGCTAYHIRRGDLTGDLKAMNKPWPHKVIPDEFYDVHIQRTLQAATGGVVLFSDDAQTIARYKARFPSLWTVRDVIDTSSLTQAQRDLIELYAIACCAVIVAPGRSAFSSAAADLSGARRIDVAADLSGEERNAALEALFKRLRDRPDSFDGPGATGQSLAHVGLWLERGGRWREAADLHAAHVAAGLNISFVYPQTMTYQHRAGDANGVIETARQMRARSVVHVRDQARAEILVGHAHLRRAARSNSGPSENDEGKTGLRHVANGFWHAPAIPAARSVIPFLVQTGLLHEQNFLPSSAVVRNIMTRRGPLKTLLRDFPDLMAVAGAAVPQTLGSMEPALWDWAPLMRSVSLPAEARRGAIGKFVAALAAQPDDGATAAERDSLLAFCRAIEAPPGPACDRLSELAASNPDDPMVLQRLSHALRLSRDFKGAAQAAERAARLAPDWPVLRAWAGMSLLRIRRFEAAAGHLRTAAAPRIGLPSIHALLAEALQGLGDQERALNQIQAALDLAPLEVGYVMRIAHLLDEAGRPEDAIGRLMPVVAADRAPARLYIALIDLLEKTGATGAARDIARQARRRRPDHPAIADRAGRLAA